MCGHHPWVAGKMAAAATTLLCQPGDFSQQPAGGGGALTSLLSGQHWVTPRGNTLRHRLVRSIGASSRQVVSRIKAGLLNERDQQSFGCRDTASPLSVSQATCLLHFLPPPWVPAGPGQGLGCLRLFLPAQLIHCNLSD